MGSTPDDDTSSEGGDVVIHAAADAAHCIWEGNDAAYSGSVE